MLDNKIGFSRRIAMSPALERLKPEIDRLTFEEREELADYLYFFGEKSDESEEAIWAAWKAEIERRIEECLTGQDEGTPVEEFMEAMRSKYNISNCQIRN
jgi:putative addiction module component (TIGR02574 family)